MYLPRDVILFNYNMGQICVIKLCIADCCSHYWLNFDARKMPLKRRPSRRYAMYCYNSKGELCFAVICGKTQLHSELGQLQGLEAQVPGQRALREEICTGDQVSTEKRNEAKKLQKTPTKKLKDLPMLKTKFGTTEDFNNLITPEMATLVSELEASAVKSMELA